MASDVLLLRVVDRCRPYPRPPLAVAVPVRLSMTFGELLEHVRCKLLIRLSETMDNDPVATAHPETYQKAVAERANMYHEGCVTLCLAPVDEASHGKLFRARTSATTVAELKMDSLRGRVSCEPVAIAVAKECPFVPMVDGAFAGAVRAAQVMAVLKASGGKSVQLQCGCGIRCLRWLAARMEVAVVIDETETEEEGVSATVYAVSWGRLVRTRKGFAKYPKAVRRQVFALLLMRNRGVFGVMDRNLCFLIGDFVVSLPQPVLWEDVTT